MDLLVTKDPQITLLLEDVTATDRSDQEDQEETDPQEGTGAEVEVVVEEEMDLILKDKQLKISDLPEFDGDDDNILDYMGKVNMIVEQSRIVQSQLGRLLPLRFTERASSWYQSLPLIDHQVMIDSWATLKAALMTHFMNPAWCAAEIAKANRIRFRDRGHENEKPVDYVVCKKLHLTLLRTWEFDPLIWEILQGAPQQWGVILRTDDLGGQWTKFINCVQQHSDALINAKSDGKGNSQLEHRLE
ncbi:hypothetical protein FRC08_018359 [Ceratobasidium sp. 394]|nr:hypothetical protein FRC08_018359 [Ceratobasidium sp. 394]